jgi:thiazole tautomerase (transcriptional regulator TenI)
MEKEIHVISNGIQKTDQFVNIASEIHPYVTAIHIREKTATAKEIYTIIKSMLDIGIPPGKIIVNDRADVAKAVHAQGVQLTYQSLDVQLVKFSFPDLRIGKSVHSLQEAVEAEQQGADYLLYGHIFSTSSKPGLAPRGLGSLQQIVKEVAIPVIAIGGITPKNTKDVLSTGAAGIAVMSSIWDAHSPVEAIRSFLKDCCF